MDALKVVLEEVSVKREALVPGFRLRVERQKWTCASVETAAITIASGYAAIVFSIRGGTVIRSNYDSVIRVFPKGHVFVQRGPASHSGSMGQGRHEWLSVTWAQGQGPLLPATLLARLTAPEFSGAMSRVQSAIGQPGDRAEGLVLSAAQEVAAYFSDNQSSFALASRVALEDPNLDSVAIAIRQDPVRPWRLGTGADIAGYSESHFSKVFQEQAGVGFREYVELCRAERAAALLHSTELPIDLVAETVGFPSTVSMRQALRRAMGLSPSDFRKKGEP